MRIEVEADIAEAHDMLAGIGDRLASPRSLLDQLGEQLGEHAEQAFATDGFGTWAPLAPATVAQKGSSRILVDTGGLLDSLTSGSPQVSDDAVTLSTDHPAAAFLRAGARGAPARDPLPEPPDGVVEDWADLSLEYFLTGGGA